MEELSNAEATLLGLLSEGPMYPDQIEQEVQYRDMGFWTELSISCINSLLIKLESRGLLLGSKSTRDESRFKTLYSISETGKTELIKKIEKILGNVEHIRWQIDIGTYNCNLLQQSKIQETLFMYRTKLKEKIDGYKDLLKFLQGSKCPDYRLAIASRPIFLLEAELKWIDSFLEQFKK